MTASVLPIISGKAKSDESVARDMLFGNIEPLTDGGLVPSKPGVCYNFMALVPNNSASEPVGTRGLQFVFTQEYALMLPNFFVETKGSGRSTSVVNR